MATSTETPSPSTVGRRALGLVLAVVAGAAVATQARINGELAVRIDDGVVAAVLSFAGGQLVLLATAALLPRMRRGLSRVAREVRSGGLRPWQLLGGACGALLVLSQGFTVGVIGVAVFTVAVVAGQAISSLLVDRAGIGPGGRRPVTVTRLVGALLTLGAVLLAVSSQLGGAGPIWIAVLPLLAGVAVAWQQAVNARVGEAAGQGVTESALPAALVNFTVGTTILLLAAVIEIVVLGPPEPLPADPLLYLGGLIGIVFITTAAAVVRLTGVLLFGLGAIGGQLVGALLLDLFVPAAGEQLAATTVAGAALALVAMVIAALPTRRRI